jgi:hypothetical protein
MMILLEMEATHLGQIILETAEMVVFPTIMAEINIILEQEIPMLTF